MNLHCDIPRYCDECIHCKSQGEIMVGSDSTGGGPEESFSCDKGRNMTYYCYNSAEICPDYDDGYDDEMF